MNGDPNKASCCKRKDGGSGIGATIVAEDESGFITKEMFPVSFSRKDVEDACTLFKDPNPAHLRAEPGKIIVPAGLVEGRTLGLTMRWVRENKLLHAALLKNKRVQYDRAIRITRIYRCYCQYSPTNISQRIRILIVDRINDITHPSCTIDLEIVYR